ncbi:MAG: hypothetical protein V4725_05985 [Bacteroidota bacterium]|nr:hypothetical protein [Ferruginibacter sp.]
MKKISFALLCLSSVLSLNAQEIPAESAPAQLTREEYLQKSKGQKTAAIILISAGGAAAIAGLAIATNDLGDDLGGIFDPNYQDNGNDTVSGILFFGGAAAMLGSIPLFVSSKRNKRRAMDLSFKNIPTSQVHQNMVINQQIPSINFRISF